MESTSEYYSTLLFDSKARYTEKVAETGLKTDPYVIPNESWTEEPIALPQLSWGDMSLYMISMLSPYIRI